MQWVTITARSERGHYLSGKQREFRWTADALNLFTSCWCDTLWTAVDRKNKKVQGYVVSKTSCISTRDPPYHWVIWCWKRGQSRANSCFMLQHTVNCHNLTNLSSLLFLSLLSCLSQTVSGWSCPNTEPQLDETLTKMSSTSVSRMTTRVSLQLKYLCRE